jgi:hypothetical protein
MHVLSPFCFAFYPHFLSDAGRELASLRLEVQQLQLQLSSPPPFPVVRPLQGYDSGDDAGDEGDDGQERKWSHQRRRSGIVAMDDRPNISADDPPSYSDSVNTEPPRDSHGNYAPRRGRGRGRRRGSGQEAQRLAKQMLISALGELAAGEMYSMTKDWETALRQAQVQQRGLLRQAAKQGLLSQFRNGHRRKE